MKKKLLEALIRECAVQVLEAMPADTVGAPAPPAADQGTADTPGIPNEPDVPLTDTAKGVIFVNPKKIAKAGYKGETVKSLNASDDAQLERQLYRLASISAGPRVKVSSAALRSARDVVKGQAPAVYLYIGKRDPEDSDEEIFLLPASNLQQAKQGSVGADTSAEHPTTSVPQDTQDDEKAQMQSMATGGKSMTMAPEIDETSVNMITSMVREALKEFKKK